jgi:PPM family protein phosphatase
MMKNEENLTGGEGELGPERFESGFATEKADRHPDRNEDAVLVDDDQRIYGCFDGLSRPPHGEVAAEAARKTFDDYWTDNEPATLKEGREKMKAAFDLANQGVHEAAGERFFGVATTASVMKIFQVSEGKSYGVIGNIGDSRIYHMGAGAGLKRLTIDDITVTIVVDQKEELLDHFDDAVAEGSLSDREEELRKNRHTLYQSLGMSDFKPSARVFCVPFMPGDQVLIATDGVHDNLTRAEIETVLQGAGTAETKAAELVRQAKERSRTDHFRAKDDDISAVVIEMKS